MPADHGTPNTGDERGVDRNGERGPVPTRNGWVPWKVARAMREYLDALKAELERLNAR